MLRRRGLVYVAPVFVVLTLIQRTRMQVALLIASITPWELSPHYASWAIRKAIIPAGGTNS